MFEFRVGVAKTLIVLERRMVTAFLIITDVTRIHNDCRTPKMRVITLRFTG